MELRSALQSVYRTTVAAASAVGRQQASSSFSTSARVQSFQRPSSPYVKPSIQALRASLSNRKAAAAGADANASSPSSSSSSAAAGLPPRPPTTFKDDPWSIVDAINKDSDASSSSSPSTLGGALYSSNPRKTSSSLSSSGSSTMQTWNETDFELRHMAPQQELNIRLRPSTGRTFYVSGQTDFATALRNLSRACAQNNVKRDVRMQKFHERPGLKRKRLRSERWRARFKIGFKAAVNRTFELKNQGW
ncbi:hypothetical protein B0T20DRAFT_205418 [Sordaria brevicollis]|uniref:Ribosomal protein S21 n=1 Tax=Sordaria brevicollis TaxID=83679 RepID=A0AAE0PEG3_SORBR|nr:hypothetical protein B0T20DRAFT_205418 [Sordaria brevicollis]